MYEIKFVPKGLIKESRGNKYPLDKLEIGQMFEAKIKERGSIYNAIIVGKKYGSKELLDREFSIRTIDDENIAIIRLK